MLLTEQLENRWMQFAKSLGADPKQADKAFLALVDAYDAPSRMYHSLSHIDSCLKVMDKHVPMRKEISSYVEMAIFWHDFVYVPGRPDNETESIGAFIRHGRRMGLDERFVADVSDMISYTSYNRDTQGVAERVLYLLDVDLSILGKSDVVFDAYENGVRFEYAFVPDPVFRSVRAGILEKMLARPFIYETKAFQVQYEKTARENLARSVAKLRSVG